MSNCKHCGRPLKESQYRNGKQYKSCPRCSQTDGEEHIYYSYPSEFGTTPLRASSNSPEGAQSQCQECRGKNASPHSGYKKCSEL
ncbi:MAG: hypothetical protein RR313_10055 [Anaerovoracaceae bacterium]